MAVPFPEAEFEILIYIALGVLIGLSSAAIIYIRKLHSVIENNGTKEERELRTDNIGLSKKAEDVMNIVVEESMLQSELPEELKVSKATVSSAVSELHERNLVQKRKKANTYLIEPKMEELEEQQKKSLGERE